MYSAYIPAAQIRLLSDIGRYIHSPGNHCLEYQAKDMIGKCKMRVAATSSLKPNVACAGTGFRADAADIETAIIETLAVKWIVAINTIIANFFIV